MPDSNATSKPEPTPDRVQVIATTIERWRRSDTFIHRFHHLMHDREAWMKAENDDLAHWIESELQRLEATDA